MNVLPPPGPSPTEPSAPVPHTGIPAVPAVRSRRALPFIVGGAVLVAVLAAAGITYAVVSAQRTPAVVVSAFLDELVAGDAEGAQSLMTSIPDGNPVMLQPETYAVTEDRISGYTVLDTAIDGAEAAATVELEQGGETYTQDLTLTRVRKDLGLFDVWRVDGANLPTVYISFARPDGMELLMAPTSGGSLARSTRMFPRFPARTRSSPSARASFSTPNRSPSRCASTGATRRRPPT